MFHVCSCRFALQAMAVNQPQQAAWISIFSKSLPFKQVLFLDGMDCQTALRHVPLILAAGQILRRFMKTQNLKIQMKPCHQMISMIPIKKTMWFSEFFRCFNVQTFFCCFLASSNLARIQIVIVAAAPPVSQVPCNCPKGLILQRGRNFVHIYWTIQYYTHIHIYILYTVIQYIYMYSIYICNYTAYIHNDRSISRFAVCMTIQTPLSDNVPYLSSS